MSKMLHESRVPAVSMIEEACSAAGILQDSKDVYRGVTDFNYNLGDMKVLDTPYTREVEKGLEEHIPQQRIPFTLSGSSYNGLLEGVSEVSEVITPISEESALYGCVERLVDLSVEESHSMPSGLTREERHEWAASIHGLTKDMKPIDPEFAKVIDEKFWELVGDESDCYLKEGVCT